MAAKRTLPDYDSPPVIETVLGVSFSPLQRWDLRHFGLLSERVRDRYPNFQVQPALTDAEETPSGISIASLIVRAVGVTEPPIRAWYIDASETMLLQVQRDRFLHNWRKVSGSEDYPHYETTIRSRFGSEWESFRQFLKSEKIDAPQLRGWEVTYVNHFERGREWETLDDLPKVLRWFNPAFKLGAVQATDAVNLEFRFDIGHSANLAISFRRAIRQRDEADILVLNLTTRGHAANEDDLMKGLDFGRATIVNAFTDMTATGMHELWKRKI